MHKITIANFKAIRNIGRSLTVGEGIDILRRLDLRFLSQEIYFAASGKGLLVRELLEESLSSHCRLMNYFPLIWFLGGPPPAEEWWLGTPADLFVDCVLRATVEYGDEWVTDILYDGLVIGAP